jgi:hypothetical protein
MFCLFFRPQKTYTVGYDCERFLTVPRFLFSIRRLFFTLGKFAIKYRAITGKPGVFRSFLHDSYGGNHRLDSSIWKKDLEISGALELNV